MKKRKRNPCLAVFLGVSISLLALGTPNTRSATIQSAAVPSDGPRIIGIGSPGEVVRKIVIQMKLDLSRGSFSNTAFGYFTSVEGVDDKDLFSESDPSKQNEATAFFTTFTNAKTIRITKNGPLIIFDAETKATAYFNPTPDRDFSHPESLKEGIVIATSEDTMQYIFDITTGSGTGVLKVRQTSAPPFMFHGELVQFCAVDAKFTISMQGKSVLYKPTRVFGAGYIIQAE